jgi:hypothetical protein
VNETKEAGSGQADPSRETRVYMILAAVLVVVIVVIVIFLITEGLPALRGEAGPTTVVDVTPTLAPTFTPGPTKEPTNTPPPAPSPTVPPFVMTDSYTPTFELLSAGARPSTEWTGFFGQVLDAQGNPLSGVSLIILYPGGKPVDLVDVPTSPIVKTDADGSYEIRLADAPLADTWSILVLTDDGYPASDFYTFETDENTETGIQQIQVMWQKMP